MKIRLASPLQTDSIVDGEGLRAVIWTQGCPHRCLGCHNPGTHDFDEGFDMNLGDLEKEIQGLEMIKGITFSGGEPFSQPEQCAKIAKCAHDKNLDVWCYSGYTFEELLNLTKSNEKILNLLENIDILVDGKFMLEFRDYNAVFRGSSNQRILDVKKSLKKYKAVVVEKYQVKCKEQDKPKLYI